ncbi:prepilin-type N-terminal cleavage/methylation domain-containing protein [Bacillus tianshenii]|uniref:Prepilin-type N-terminal cleavage/methylation domain-containing protein n=1 Tax=Sutcliffiella tianshenii TaxID=1463404 RepID=A0ABS2P0M0_9BACI|nr:prepilin-type N-terminal cleavage/methylation domain-containing protein [Bacillus tianshenii]MBM7620467.1 prepilin-type N-terminal cleavage/methylation domain-containing protein [Bacillus tianshenii]
MKQIIEKNGGFTLIEVLVSITIFSIILLGMMTFFTNGLTYVKENESKTVATQVARNVMNYMEKQDFGTFEAFTNQKMMDLDPTVNFDSPFSVTINLSSCAKVHNLMIKPYPNSLESDRLQYNNVKLFSNEIQCNSIFNPIINNVTLGSSSINVYVMKYYDQQLEEELNDNPEIINLPSSVKKAYLNQIDILTLKDSQDKLDPDSDIAQHLLRIFVVVDWTDNRDEIMLQGVIAHESIR